MLKNLINKKRLQEGFTIIEVMIVLAIAGLILVVVLIAIPQLQRNQRNENRRSVATRIVTEINTYAGNNNGNLPDANITGGQKNFAKPNIATGFFARYFKCTATACETNINDPRTGVPVGTGTIGGVDVTTTLAIAGSSTVPAATPGSIAYNKSLLCDGELATATGASPRNFVFQMRLEGGAVFCLDNK